MRAVKVTDPLDCSRPATASFWFLLGMMLALFIMVGASRGAWPALLHVGAANPALSAIERELGHVPTPDDTGHDGQFYYLIARDPFGLRTGPQAIASHDEIGPRYRYRRILFPLLAGGFGQFSGYATLIGLIAVSAIGMGLGMAAIVDLAHQLKLRGAPMIVAAMHPGVLVSLNLLIADTLAIGLALAGIALTLRGCTRWAIVVFVLAVLTKDLYCLVPVATAVWLWRRKGLSSAALFATLPIGVLLIWEIWVRSITPAPAESVKIFDVPFAGLLESFPLWMQHESEPSEIVFAATSLFMVFAGAFVVAVGRNALLRLVLAPWLVVACCSAVRVWEKPNNAARGFALLWPLGVLLLSQWFSWNKAVNGGRD